MRRGCVVWMASWWLFVSDHWVIWKPCDNAVAGAVALQLTCRDGACYAVSLVGCGDVTIRMLVTGNPNMLTQRDCTRACWLRSTLQHGLACPCQPPERMVNGCQDAYPFGNQHATPSLHTSAWLVPAYGTRCGAHVVS